MIRRTSERRRHSLHTLCSLQQYHRNPIKRIYKYRKKSYILTMSLDTKARHIKISTKAMFA